MSEILTIVTLEDGLGNRCQVSLSPEDARRCETDLDFAQRLMNASLQTDPLVQPGPSSSTSNEANTCWSPQDDDVASTFKWGHSAILLVVEAYRSHVNELTAGKISQKKVWEKISKSMAEKGHMVSGPQCMSKFNGMKRTFKAISDHNSKSGNNPRSWTYFELMRSLLGERPFMEPPALSSSSSGRMTSRESSERTDIDDPAPSPNSSRSRKRQASEGFQELTNAILESRRIAEEGKNRRHEEKLQQKAAILSRLDALLDKL